MPRRILVLSHDGKGPVGRLPRRTADRDRVGQHAVAVAIEQHALRNVDDNLAGGDIGRSDMTIIDEEVAARLERLACGELVIGRDGRRVDAKTCSKARQRFPAFNGMSRDSADT
jgi:hypothetical protein